MSGSHEDDKPPPDPGEEPPELPAVLDLLTDIDSVQMVCQRCGNDDWWTMDKSTRPSERVGSFRLHVGTIACTRCGLIERYVIDIVSGKVKGPSK
jgi:hypothetical protein